MSLFSSLFHDCLDAFPTMEQSSLGAEWTCSCGRRYVCTDYAPGPEPFAAWAAA